jgi:D-alanyl-D-alanine carboxypeptidase/D-alanyl-D-alanine-endopeptidase (penicillin-binding protein 4)
MITGIVPDPVMKINNMVKAGKAGSGDDAYIYAGPYAKTAYVNGTIPPNSRKFSISGSLPEPGLALGIALRDMLIKNGIRIDSVVKTAASSGLPSDTVSGMKITASTQQSPAVDSIIYWFLKRSINLYGEALVKTFAKQVNGKYQLEDGVEIMRSFWEKQGVEKSAFKVNDGSGLSPSNRVTVAALVKVMQYAKNSDWFNVFYDALPEYNGIKMKSGTINGVKSFTGYIKSKSGKEYTIAIAVNNFDGSASQIVQKLYTILDILK